MDSFESGSSLVSLTHLDSKHSLILSYPFPRILCPDGFFALCLYLLPARSTISARVRTLRPETIATVHWPSISWLEWYLSFISTTCTRRRVHLTLFAIVIATIISRTPIARLGFACCPASGTTARAVHQTTAGIEFLLPSGEHKLLIAIAAIQFLIGC